jgi:hypothetical protein
LSANTGTHRPSLGGTGLIGSSSRATYGPDTGGSGDFNVLGLKADAADLRADKIFLLARDSSRKRCAQAITDTFAQ